MKQSPTAARSAPAHLPQATRIRHGRSTIGRANPAEPQPSSGFLPSSRHIGRFPWRGSDVAGTIPQTLAERPARPAAAETSRVDHPARRRSPGLRAIPNSGYWRRIPPSADTRQLKIAPPRRKAVAASPPPSDPTPPPHAPVVWPAARLFALERRVAFSSLRFAPRRS